MTILLTVWLKTARCPVRGYLKNKSLVGSKLSLWHLPPLKVQCQGGCWICTSGASRKRTRRKRHTHESHQHGNEWGDQGAYTARGKRRGDQTEDIVGWEENQERSVSQKPKEGVMSYITEDRTGDPDSPVKCKQKWEEKAAIEENPQLLLRGIFFHSN